MKKLNFTPILMGVVFLYLFGSAINNNPIYGKGFCLSTGKQTLLIEKNDESNATKTHQADSANTSFVPADKLVVVSRGMVQEFYHIQYDRVYLKNSKLSLDERDEKRTANQKILCTNTKDSLRGIHLGSHSYDNSIGLSPRESDKPDSFNIRNPAKTNSLLSRRLNFYMGLRFGISIPAEDYADNSLNNSRSGFAQTGGNMSIDFTLVFDNWLGIGLWYYGSGHVMDKVYKDLNPAASLPDNSPYYYVYELRGWQHSHAYAGPDIRINFNKRSFLSLKCMVGFISSQSPFINHRYYNKYHQLVAASRKTAGNGTSFSYLLGTGINYFISENLAIQISAHYLKANPFIKYNIQQYQMFQVSGPGVWTKNIELTWDQPVKLYNINLGINFKIPSNNH